MIHVFVVQSVCLSVCLHFKLKTDLPRDNHLNQLHHVFNMAQVLILHSDQLFFLEVEGGESGIES